MKRAASPTEEEQRNKMLRITNIQQICSAPLSLEEILGYVNIRKPLIIGFFKEYAREVDFTVLIRTSQNYYGINGWTVNYSESEENESLVIILDGRIRDDRVEPISEDNMQQINNRIQHDFNERERYYGPKVMFVPDLLNYKRILHHRLECRQMNPNFAIQHILAHLEQRMQLYQRYLQTGNLWDLITIYTYLVSQIRVLNPEYPAGATPEIPSLDTLFVDLFEISLTLDLRQPFNMEPEQLPQFEADVVKMRTLTPILYEIVSRTLVTA